MPPIPPALLGSLASSGSSLFGNIFNAISQAKTNRSQMAWNEKMYARQRGDALQDWNNTNAYNHPSAIMARLREAGINPVTAFGETTQSSVGTPRSSTTGSYSPHAPQVDPSTIGNAVNSMYDIKIKEATVDNLREQNTVLVREAMLKEAQRRATLADAGLREFDLSFKSDTRPYSLEGAKLNVDRGYADWSKTQAEQRQTEANTRKIEADTQYTLNQDQRAAKMNATSISKMLTEILAIEKGLVKTDAETRHINKQIELANQTWWTNAMDRKLREQYNIRPGTGFPEQIARALENTIENVKRRLGRIDLKAVLQEMSSKSGKR